jgi:DNA polymerase-3 subunit alpha
MRFVSLHHHTTFSYGDGYGTPAHHIMRSAELGMTAQAVTEHGNVSSYVQHEKAGLKFGVKPLFGLEAYVAPSNMRERKNQRKTHLTLLAMNHVGYVNLMRLVTLSWSDNFYRWPTIHWENLKQYNEGIIVISGCADSELNCSLLGGKYISKPSQDRARKVIDKYQRVFGDRYYMEVQQFPELERTRLINPWAAEEAERRGIQIVATADVHYPKPDDNRMQVILHAARRGNGTVEDAEASWEYDIRLTHPLSDRFIWERLRGTGLSGRQASAAIMATAEIAERCDVTLPKASRLRYPLPAGATSSQELAWRWLREGWRYRAATNKRMLQRKEEYAQRIRYEMELIESKDYLDYFLMLSDGVRWAKDNFIPVGPARGSAAASLCCYLWRITEIDPMPFPNMLFERFIDINRTDLPDVDLDFDDERRFLVVDHYTEMYGEDHVAKVGTYTKYRGKNALDDVARVFSIPKWEVQPVKDLMIERSGGDSRIDASLEDTFSMFAQAGEVLKKHPDLNKAIRLEGNYRDMSVHAAGLVISNDPLVDNVAYYTQYDKNDQVKNRVMSVDKKDAEYLGLLKADFLGLKTMGMIRRSLEMIDMPLADLYTIPLDDPKIIAAFKRNDVVGIFQFSGGATKIVNGDVKPDNFLELCDINSLSRPGPLHSGTTNDYINIKHGRKKAEHLHPVIDEITQHTQYCIIYQEQILQILKEIGGLPWTHLNQIRKIISLKEGVAAFDKVGRLDFIQGARDRHGIKEKDAAYIFNRMVTAGQYAFNSSHCVSYSMLSYWQMFLKVYHPSAFYAGNLIKFDKDEYNLLRDALSHGIKILGPDLDESQETWVAGVDGIRGGFQQIDGIGPTTGPLIVRDREDNGPFASWEDLERIKGIGPKTAEKIRDVAQSEDPYGIHRVDNVLDRVRKAIASGELGIIPEPTHKGAEIPTDAENLKVTYVGIPYKRNPQDVIEDERARTGDDYDVIIKRMKDPHLSKKMVITCMDDSDTHVYVRFWRQSFPMFEKAAWSINLDHDVIVVQGVKRGGFGTGIHVRKLWVIDPDELGEEE